MPKSPQPPDGRRAPMKFRFGTLSFDGDALAELAIDPENLAENAADHPARAAFWGVLKAHAIKAHRESYASRKQMAARLYNELKASGEKMTETALTNAVEVDPRYVAAKNAEDEAEFQAEQIGAIVSAMTDRRHLLCSLTTLTVASESGVRSPDARRAGKLPGH